MVIVTAPATVYGAACTQESAARPRQVGKATNMVLALAALVVFQLVGEIIVSLFALPLPGPVVGLVLLYVALVIYGGVPENLRATGNVLLQHLMLFLIPATTGLMMHFRRLGDEWLPILLAAVCGTAVTMALTAVTLRLFLEWRRAP